jgi:diacylglycerol kinase (ATP)
MKFVFNELANLKNTSSILEKIAIVCNITAGKGKSSAVLKKILQKISDLKIPYEVYTDTWPENFKNFTSAWLIGGDGTLNYFINQYPGLDIPLALFKGGSGNDFAWKLYGNKSIDEYFEIVLNGRVVKSDIGICNGRYFINGVGIGFDGEVVKAMGQKKILPGHLGYLVTVLKKIFLYREKEMEITIDDLKRNEKIFMITIANGSRYGGGFLVAPQAIVNDGELDIVIIKQIASLKRLSYLPKVEVGKHLHLSLIEVLKKKKITVKSHFILNAHLDGELMEANKFEIEIIPERFLFIY